MNDLGHYLKVWNLRDPDILAQSLRGSVYVVYRDTEKAVLKICTSIGAEDEADGAIALQYYDGYGAIRLMSVYYMMIFSIITFVCIRSVVVYHMI